MAPSSFPLLGWVRGLFVVCVGHMWCGRQGLLDGREGHHSGPGPPNVTPMPRKSPTPPSEQVRGLMVRFPLAPQ